MPYNRTKGRTTEIPPSPSPGPSRLGRSKSVSSIQAVASAKYRPLDPHQLEAHLEAQIARQQQPAPQSCSAWRRAVVHIAGLLTLLFAHLFHPLYCFWDALVCFYLHAPAVVPAGVAMAFLYVGLPLLIAWDVI